MKIKNNTSSFALWISLSAIFILAVFSIITFKQRMLFLDPAWVAFNIINTKSLLIPGYRFGAFITQIVPLAGVYLGLSLRTILILYSFSFYCFFLGAALVIGLKFKQNWLVVLLAVYLTLFVSDVYYWPIDEVHQGITWMFLFFGLYLFQTKKKNVFSHILLVVFAVLAISCHMLVSVPFLFLWILIHADKKLKPLLRNKQFLCYSVLILLLIALRYCFSKANGYDNVKLEGVKRLSFKSVFLSFKSGQAKTFARLILFNYWLSIPVFLWGIIFWWQSKKYRNLTLLLLFTVGYFILICITFPDGHDRTLRFYFEAQWVALSIIIATPFVVWLKGKKNWALLLILLFGIRLAYIFNSYSYFNYRLNNLKKVVHHLQKSNCKKALIIENDKQANQYFIMGWGIPVESMMLSKLEGNKTLTTFKVTEQTPPAMEARDSFYSCFGIASMKTLNSQYFRLDTLQKYQVIKGLNKVLE